MTFQRFFLVGLAFVLLLGLAVGLTQAQEAAGDGDGKDSRGPESAEVVVTTGFNYQGVLKEGGEPVTGSRNMNFVLYKDNSCTGSPLATVPKNGVAVADGFFNVSLDFSQDFFNGQALWLQTVVGGTTIGCQALTAVPYALSLRPGAHIYDSRDDYILQLGNEGNGSVIRALSSGASVNEAALYGFNAASEPGTAVMGISYNGNGVLARSHDSDYAALKAENDTGPAALLTAQDELYGAKVENMGSGDGVRGNAYTSTSPNWAAVYGYNVGTGSGVWGHSSSGYSGYFAGDIYIDGNCTGCSQVYIGFNGGTAELAVGDLVAVRGVEAPLAGAATPVLRLVAADASNGDALLGVVQSAGELVSDNRDGRFSENVIRADGAVAPGSYFFITVQGLAQVKVNGPVAAGERVALTNGVARAAEGADGVVIGWAVESSAEGGLVWVMLDIR